MRHDFSDQIMVRYQADGEDYDTWISGEEVLQRLKSESREQQLRRLSQLGWDDLKDMVGELRARGLDVARDQTERSLRERLGEAVDEAIGGNVIGDSLADAVRGVNSTKDPAEAERQAWLVHLSQPAFRAKVLELAWLNLRGSLPEAEQAEPDYDDWT